MEISDKLQGILATLPAKPGCYIMKNAAGTISYVGKAINLKNRVRSYFHETVDSPKTLRHPIRIQPEGAPCGWRDLGRRLLG